MAGSHEISTTVFRFLLPKMVPNVGDTQNKLAQTERRLCFWSGSMFSWSNFSCRHSAVESAAVETPYLAVANKLF
jgi:hypothetical protein